MVAGVKLTKTYVDSIVEDGFYWDSELSGFGLRKSGKTKSYIAQRRINGQDKRITIGKHGIFTPDEARKDARQTLAQMARGIDPKAGRKASKLEAIRVGQVFDDFLLARKALKPRTISDYRLYLNKYFPDWIDRPIVSISREMVAKRHAELGSRSEAQANVAMRFLRALMNFASGKYDRPNGEPLIAYNPVKILSTTRAWYGIPRRISHIEHHKIKDWFDAVISLKNDPTSNKRETVRDYLIFLLFTGLRRTEAASLQWKDVSFEARCFTVTDTKNGLDHSLPMSDFIYQLLTERRRVESGAFVFSGNGAQGHIVEPRKQMERVTALSGVEFSLHDLRRTFGTYAGIVQINDSTIKRMLNHKIAGQDVTERYKLGVERLRVPVQQVTDYMLQLIGGEVSAEALPLLTVEMADLAE